METTKDAIKAWLKKFGHSREWLGQKCGSVTLKAVNNWLSTDRSIPTSALHVILRLMIADESAELKARCVERTAIHVKKLAHASFDELMKIEDQMKLDEQADEDAMSALKSRIYCLLRQDFPEAVETQELLEELGLARRELEKKMQTWERQRGDVTQKPEDPDRAQSTPSPMAPLSYLSLPVDVSEFNAWGEAALKRGQTVTTWAMETLHAASSSGHNQA